jgi:hypothetical protein
MLRIADKRPYFESYDILAATMRFGEMRYPFWGVYFRGVPSRPASTVLEAELLQNGRAKLGRTHASASLEIGLLFRDGIVATDSKHWFQPKDVTVAILGPERRWENHSDCGSDRVFGQRHSGDGIASFAGASRRDRVGAGWLPVKDPQGRPVRGPRSSMLYLSAFFPDYFVGYLLVMRLLLAKFNSVRFDRYFRELLVDLWAIQVRPTEMVRVHAQPLGSPAGFGDFAGCARRLDFAAESELPQEEIQ